MKKNLLSVLAMACIAVASQLISCTQTTSYEPVRTDEPGPHSHYDSSRYRLNEIIVMFKKQPNTTDINKLKAKVHAAGIDSAMINRDKKCNCNAYVEVWHADSLHSRIHADGIRAGSVSDKGSKGVGEDGIAYYSLNFMQNIPVDSLENFEDFPYDPLKKVENDTVGREVVRIAVLDTGIDTEKIIGTSYRWTNKRELSAGKKGEGKDDDNNCFIDDSFGWNFIGNNNDVMDDNQGRHGTLVSHYIINEFATSRNKAVKLMTLKTHDKDGSGELFSAICAIYYAMEKRAQIINASWGFYYYQARPHPYLDSLITEVLRAKGILFIAAAGNKIKEIDDLARNAYSASHPGVTIPDSYLRNLEYHNFYPACLSRKDNNVVTVTTANKTRVSPTQNYSSNYVDMGAIPDDTTLMRFNVPFAGPAATISGSSFAAPIMTGRIGAFLPNSSYAPNIDKRVLLNQIEGAGLSRNSSLLESNHIRKGRITPHN